MAGHGDMPGDNYDAVRDRLIYIPVQSKTKPVGLVIVVFLPALVARGSSAPGFTPGTCWLAHVQRIWTSQISPVSVAHMWFFWRRPIRAINYRVALIE